MLRCLDAPPTQPPRNALAKEPEIAQMIGLYSQVKNLGALPEAGGILDQRADHMVYFSIFSGAEAEHLRIVEGRR